MQSQSLVLKTGAARRRELFDFAKRVAARFRPERIILFGSYAYGRPTEDSDADILVVMQHEGDAWVKAAEISRAIERDFPLDLIVRDAETLQRRIEQHDWFLKEIVERGEVLYEAPH